MIQNNLVTRMFLLFALIVGSVNSWADTTYKLTQVTSVEAGKQYVFKEGSNILTTVSNKAIQSVTTYSTTGLTGSESYVWTLEKASKGFYMKMSNGNYLGNTSSSTDMTSVSAKSSAAVWAFNFQTDNTVMIQNTGNNNRFIGNNGDNAYKAYATGAMNEAEYSHAVIVYKLEEEDVQNLEDNNLSITNASTDLTFDLYNNASSQVINYTTSSTGAITITPSSPTKYFSYIHDAENKTITITPIAVTPTAQAITITQAADNQYKSGTATFSVTVDDTTPVRGIIFDATSDKDKNNTAAGVGSITKDIITYSCSDGILGNGSEYRMYKNSTTTISTTFGNKITQIEFIGTSGYSATGFANQTGWKTSGNNGVWTGEAESVSFTASGAQVRATMIKVTVNVGVSVAATGFSTYVNPGCALDFEGTGITPYVIKAKDASSVTLEAKMTVAKNEPVLLYKDGGTSEAVAVPVISTATADNANLLVAGDGSSVTYSETNHYYVLTTVDNVTGFYRANNNPVPVGKAYLDAGTATSARFFELDLNEEATSVAGIERMRNVENDTFYNLAGQQVAQPTKGLYIVNGKKVLVK